SGIGMDPPPLRISIMAESLSLMKALWTSETVSFTGTHYTLNSAQGFPRPEVRPRIIVGGGGKRMVGIAPREADIVGINPNLRHGLEPGSMSSELLPGKWDEKLQWVADAAGDRMDTLDLQVLVVSVRVGASQTERNAAAARFGVSPMQLGEV